MTQADIKLETATAPAVLRHVERNRMGGVEPDANTSAGTSEINQT